MNNRRSTVTVLQIALLVLVVGFVAYADPKAEPRYEATFADSTESGLAVVPASGVSQTSYTGTYTGSYTSASCIYPIEGGWDAYGRILYANYANRYIYFNSIYACVTNNTANTFFVPAGSYSETNSFVTAGPGLGVTVVRIF